MRGAERVSHRHATLLGLIKLRLSFVNYIHRLFFGAPKYSASLTGDVNIGLDIVHIWF